MAKQPLLYPLSCRGEKYEAHYTFTGIPEFDRNKYITTLPDYNRDDIAKRIDFHPAFDPLVRQATIEKRITSLKILFGRFFQVLMHHVDYGWNIFDAIRLGLVNRNPEDPRFVERINEVLIYLDALWEEESQLENIQLRQNFRSYDYHQDTNRELYNRGELAGYHGFHFVGHAGMGKTVATCHLLKTLPQLIKHRELSGPFDFAHQLVWFVQSTPHDGSLKTLCANFLKGVTALTGKKYDELYRVDNDQTTITKLMLAMATVCAVLNIGVYVLDEIQYLLHSRGQNQIWVFNFLNDLTNSLGIPVIMMGTYPALELLGGEFRQLRRGLEQPQQDWHPLPYVSLGNEKPIDDSWRVFIQEMWGYQVVRKPVELDEFWNTFFHQRSMGVIDIARKLFIFSQIRAMLAYKETLTSDIVWSVYHDYFAKIGQYSDIYYKREWHRLTQFSDYPTITIEEFIERDRQIEAYPKLVYALSDGQLDTKSDEPEVLESTAAEPNGNNGAAVKEPPGNNAQKPVADIVNLPKGDLRRVVKEGETRGLSPAQALEKAGHVVDPVEFLRELSKK